ncbi:MAG: GspH/FimT family pseudopilin [Candidatus Methylomirabilales bacterium]
MQSERETAMSKKETPEDRRKRAREGGFSLIEIILLVVLIGILSAVAVVRFPTIPKAGGVARKLTSDIRYAKEMAIRLQTMCGIYFIDSSSYRVFQDNDTNKATIDPVTGTDMVVTLSGQFAGVTLNQTFAGNTLKFNALGTPLDGTDTPLAAAGTITVAGNGGNRTVTVEPNTGKVTGS